MTNNRLMFVDTWGWLALGHRRDSSHLIVKQLYQKLRTQKIPLYTSDYILDELITLLFKREVFQESVTFVDGILKAAKKKIIIVETITPERLETTWELRKKLQDKPWISFTDLTSMVLMKELEIQQIITGDEHFLQVGMGFVPQPNLNLHL